MVHTLFYVTCTFLYIITWLWIGTYHGAVEEDWKIQLLKQIFNKVNVDMGMGLLFKLHLIKKRMPSVFLTLNSEIISIVAAGRTFLRRLLSIMYVATFKTHPVNFVVLSPHSASFYVP